MLQMFWQAPDPPLSPPDTVVTSGYPPHLLRNRHSSLSGKVNLDGRLELGSGFIDHVRPYDWAPARALATTVSWRTTVWQLRTKIHGPLRMHGDFRASRPPMPDYGRVRGERRNVNTASEEPCQPGGEGHYCRNL